MVTLVRDLARQLSEFSHIQSPRLEAELFLSEVLNVRREELLIREFLLNERQKDILSNFVHRRIEGEPFAYILGKKEFYGRPFLVGRGVLIPRPETEFLVDTILQLRGIRRVLDIGAGSGAIGISIALERADVQVDLVESSNEAFDYLKKNIQLHGCLNVRAFRDEIESIEFSLSDFDVVVSNPPYISLDDKNVEEMVKKYEPSEALFAEEAGLRNYRIWSKIARNRLRDGGYVVFEIGATQEAAVQEILESLSFSEIKTVNDLAGHPRCIYAVKRR